MMVAKATGYKYGKFTRVVNNLHIYDKHIPIAEELLKRPISNNQPQLILDTDKTDFFEFTIDDFKVINYEPKERITIPIAI